MKKKIIAFALVICLAVIAVAGASLAYFTDSEVKTNVMTIGKIDINLEERMKNAEGEMVPFVDKAVPMYPLSDKDGAVSYNKVVDVYNEGTGDAYIRTIIAIENTTMPGVDYEEIVSVYHHGYSNQVVETYHEAVVTIDGRDYTVLVFDQAPGADGVVAPVKAGEKIQSLQSLWIDASVTQEMLSDLDGELEVMVLAQGVQTVGFDSYAEAMASFGEINGENLTKWFTEAYPAVINDHVAQN